MPIECACGCGAKFEALDSKKRLRRYISGHNSRIEHPYKASPKPNCLLCGASCKRLHAKFCSHKCAAKHLSNDLDYKERQRQLILAKGNKPPEHKGENHWNWKGGIGKQNRGQDYKYLQWRKDVFAKFNFTCQECGIRGGKLSAHHIKEWAKYLELRYDLENGLCLCYECHMALHGLTRKNNAKCQRKAA